MVPPLFVQTPARPAGWVGAAGDGGFIGEDFAAFFSSVISGAAGTYVVTMTEGQDVRTDVTIEPGQVVVVGGDPDLPAPPTWGPGGFTVGETASLSMSYLQVPAHIINGMPCASLLCGVAHGVFEPTADIVHNRTHSQIEQTVWNRTAELYTVRSN